MNRRSRTSPVRLLLPLVVAVLALLGCSGGEREISGNDLPVRCVEEPDPGPCEAHILNYYFDYRHDRCRAFHYGGCGGRVPFETMQACERACLGKR